MAGVFPTSGSPTGATTPPPPLPPGTGNFPSVSLSNDYVKVRFLEPNAAQGVNQRWLGMPRGVWLGYIPSVTPGSDILTLGVDPNHNFSLLKVPSSDETLSVDIFTGEAVTLDFTAHNVWPVYVLATASYRTNRPTQGKIFTRASTANSINEVLICKVDKLGVDLVVESTSPTSKQPPVAFQTQPYGYMPGGAIDALASTNSTVNEVIAARNSLITGPHGSLAARLDADMDGSEITDRLGLRLVHLLSNVHPDRSGTSANVSGSFSEAGREIAPFLTIEPNGSESTEGAITDGTRNMCFVIDGSTGQRLIDETTREPVYGVTSFAVSAVGFGKEIYFVNASTAVNGNGTNPFQAPIEEGDLVEGPDGLFYELETFTDPDNAVLGAAYRGSDGFTSNATLRRWTIFFATVAAGPFNIATPTSIQFLFPCFYRLNRAIFDGFLLAKKDGERPQLSVATDSEPGKALVAANDGLVGAIRSIKDVGVVVKLDAHTLNFTAPNAITTNAGGGVVNVSAKGDKGPIGLPFNQGPQGPTGAAGFGYSVQNTFELSPETGDTITAVGPVSLSFTVNWTAVAPPLVPTIPRTYAHVTGGWGTINGFNPAGAERIHIDELVDVDQDRTRITVRIEPAPNLSNTTLKAFMGASQ